MNDVAHETLLKKLNQNQGNPNRQYIIVGMVISTALKRIKKIKKIFIKKIKNYKI